MTIRYLPESIFDGNTIRYDTAVVVDGKHILALEPPRGDEINLAGLLVPGFIDVQVNGGGGVLFNETTTVAGLKQIIDTHSCYGSTGILPTLITDSVDVMAEAADAVALAIRQQIPGILGIHFEGPHLSEAKKGVHSDRFIRPFSDAEKAIYARQDLGIKVVTLAPENVSPVDIQFLTGAGVRVCLGHSNASYEQTCHALEAGASGFTHLYNAMSALSSREPGMVGAALADRNSWCGLIVDGFHVHSGAAKVAIAAKPQGKIMLVTDAMPPLGTTSEQFAFFGSTVKRSGDRLNALTGELAGSCLDMASAVRNTVDKLDVPLTEALRMASLYPAQYLGIDARYGRIESGYRADFALLDSQLKVSACWIHGNRVFLAQPSA